MASSDSQVVVNCYSAMERFFAAVGFLDMTEGIYDGNPDTPYEVAQQRQIDYLLDEVGCRSGSRILELGCGNGTLLEAVEQRGGQATGITISPEQLRRCRAQGLDVHLINYRHLGECWHEQFDAIVANGSVEHFVQPRDAQENRADVIYRELFSICHRLIDPASPSRRFATTTIHFVRPVTGEQMGKSPWLHPPFSDAFHYSLLAHSFGGYYPHQEQLARCAAPYFQLVNQVDGTHDYHLTSEHWLRQVQSRLCSRRAISLFGRALPYLARHPVHFAKIFSCTLLTQSWNWQFRTNTPPTQLLRQTWEYAQI